MNRSDKLFLRSLILEQVEELFASAGDEEVSTTRLEKDSLDDQIDSFILKFEKDSITSEDNESDSLNESLSNMTLDFLLEQDEEEADEPGPGDEAEAEEAPAEEAPAEDPEPAGSEDSDVVAATELPRPPLDVDAFTKRIARLAMNFENLLDVKTVIVNRAMNFLNDNYDKEHSIEMKDILDTQFDFDLDGGKETPPAPFAVGANPAGAGMAGGGGG